MSIPPLSCPRPRCAAAISADAEACPRCGAHVRAYARLSAQAGRLFNDGLAAARDGRPAAARDLFAAVVHWCPADTEARNALALAAYQLGDTDEARRQWEAVRERRPGDALAGQGLERISRDPG